MSLLKAYINEVEVNEPKNLSDLIIKINHDSNSESETVGSLQFEFFNQSAKLLNVARKSSTGVFEGVPFRLELDSQKGFKKDIVNGYIDLWGAEYANNSINANVTQLGGIDDFNDKIDSFTFEYLESIGKINNDNYIHIPYCISKEANGIEVIFSIVTVFILTDKIIKEIESLAELAGESANPFEATSIARVILRLVYLAVLVISLIEIIYQLYITIVQPVKYHATMKIVDLIKIGCEHLGFEFRSSFLQQYPFNKMVLLPEKYTLNPTSFIGVAGNLTPDSNQKGYYNGLFGDFFRAVAMMFHARVIVKDNIVYMEKQNFKLGVSNFQLPNLLDSKDEFRFNKEDFATTLEISFSYDLQDRNTIREWTGTNYQVNQLPIAISNSKLQIGKGLKQFKIPFALGRRKEKLNDIEKILDAFFESIDVVIQSLVISINIVIFTINILIDIINALLDAPIIGQLLAFDIPQIPYIEIESFSNLIDNRIGMLKMETDFVSTPKILLIEDNGKLMSDNATILSAKYFYDNFFYFESFAKNGDWIGNQFLLRKFDKIKFSVKDFEKVIDNKFILDGQGNEAEILTLDYNPIEETASGTYRTHLRYLDNIKIETIEPNGR